MSKPIVMSGLPPGVVSLKVTGDENCGLKVVAGGSAGLKDSHSQGYRQTAGDASGNHRVPPLGSVQDALNGAILARHRMPVMPERRPARDRPALALPPGEVIRDYVGGGGVGVRVGVAVAVRVGVGVQHVPVAIGGLVGVAVGVGVVNAGHSGVVQSSGPQLAPSPW